MHTLTVDGHNISVNEVVGSNLEEILAFLMEHPTTDNRVITDVLVNGESYSEEVPHAALEVERESIQELAVITHTAEDLSLNFLKNAPHFLNSLRLALSKIVEEFRLGDEVEANEHFLGFLETLHLAVSMVEQAKITMGLADDRPLAEHGSLNEYLASLGEVLDRLSELQKQTDWIYLADVLEYELDDALGQLAALLPLLAKTGH